MAPYLIITFTFGLTMSAKDDLYEELDEVALPRHSRDNADEDDEDEDKAMGRRNLDKLIEKSERGGTGEVSDSTDKNDSNNISSGSTGLENVTYKISDNARFFILQPDSFSDIQAAHTSGELFPPIQISERLLKAVDGGEVWIIFSVNLSKSFQGFAQVKSGYSKSDSRV